MKNKITILLCIIFAVLLTGCDLPLGGNDEEISKETITAVFQTVVAALSQTPQPTNTFTPTSTSTATATASLTPSATASQTVQADSSADEYVYGKASGCDNAAFAGDVTIPDGTQFDPETPFIKTWRISNTGSCTWNSGYSVVFVRGDGMSGISPQSLTFETTPGSSREISVDLVTPLNPGTYTGHWQLINPAKELFGHSFYVEIVVKGDGSTIPSATPTGPTNTPAGTITPTSTSATVELVINSITFNPSEPTKDNDVIVEVKIENKGDASASAFLVEWWANVRDDPAPAKTWNVSSLSAKSTKVLSYTYSYGSKDTFDTKAYVDSVNSITESDEGNNQLTKSVTVK